MSERKSWDVARKPAPLAARPVIKRPEAVVTDVRPSPRVQPRSNERLRDRRRKKHRALGIVLLLILTLLFAAGVYLLWRPAFRIATVEVAGVHTQEVHILAADVLSGTYAYIVPRNSIYFFPTEALRSRILLEYPDISAVSITRTSFGSITVTTLPRTSAFLWCGETMLASKELPHCYNVDSEGLVFEEVTTPEVGAAATSTQEVAATLLTLYSPLEPTMPDPGNPIRAHVLHAERIPAALAFIKGLGESGVSVSALEVVADEAHIYTPSHSRITYVLGREEAASTLAKAVLPKLNLTDGSIQYLDLRFSGKAYIKRTGKAEETP